MAKKQHKESKVVVYGSLFFTMLVGGLLAGNAIKGIVDDAERRLTAEVQVVHYEQVGKNTRLISYRE